MTDEPLGIGLVGCGMIGQIHADGLAKLAADGEIRTVAAADPSAEGRAAASRNAAGPTGPGASGGNGFTRLHADGMAVIDDPEVQAVMVTTPTAAHRDLVLAVLEAGKPLFCEKPLAPTFAVVRELCDAVAASGVTAQVGFHSRFHPIWARFAEIVRSGELGRMMGYTLRDDQYWPTGQVVPGHSSWRSERAQAGGGALLEHSIHSADLLSWLFGPARTVYARTRNMFGYDVEDTATLTIEHDGGVIGNLVTIFNGVRGREERRFEAFFEQGAVEITTDFLVGAPEDSFLVQRPDEPPEPVDPDRLRDAHFTTLGIARRDFLFYTYPADRAWVHAARSGAAGVPGFDDALAAHALVEAAYRSAATGSPVDLVGDLAIGVHA